MNVWKCKLILHTDTLQQKIEIADFKKHLASENTSECVYILLYIYIYSAQRKHTLWKVTF